MWDGAKSTVFPGDPFEKTPFNPRFLYLRVDTGGHTVFLVLGYLDPVADEAGATEEVWYSGDREVVRLWKGRLGATAGLPVDWRDVRYSAIPAWRAVRNTPSGGSYQRTRDVMPGYVTDLRETVTIRAIATPAKTRTGVALPEGVQWFEETAVNGQGQSTLPPARYAVDLTGTQEQVVYSEQCLSDTLCLVLQPLRNPGDRRSAS